MGRYEEWLANHPNNPDNQNRETNTGSTQTTGGSRYEEWRGNHPNNPNNSSTGAGAGGTAPASGTTWSTGAGGGRSYIKTFQEWQEKNPGYRYMITDEDGNERWDEDGWNYYLENVSGTDAQGNELTGVDALDYLDRYEQHMRQMLGMEESTGAEDGEKFADYYQPQRYEGVYVYSGEDEGLKNYVNLLNEQRLLDSDGTAQREFIADPYPWMKQTQGRLAEEAKQIQELEKKYGEAERKGSYRQGAGIGGYDIAGGRREKEQKEYAGKAEEYAALLAKAQADYAKDERDYGTMTEMFGTPEEKEAADRYEAWVNDRLGSGKTWEEIYADAVKYAEDAQGWKQDAYNDLTAARRAREQTEYANMWADIFGEDAAPDGNGEKSRQALSRLGTAQEVSNRAQEQLIFAQRNRYRDLTDSPDYDRYAQEGEEIVKGLYGNAGPAQYSEEEITAAEEKLRQAQEAYGRTTAGRAGEKEQAAAYANLETARQELERMQTGSKGTQEREWWQKLAYAMATPFGRAAIGYSENDPYARPTEDWSEEELKLYYAITSQRGEEEAASYAREVNNSIGEKSKAEKLQPITEKTLGAETLGRKLGTDAAALAGQVAAMPGRLFSWADKMAQTIGTGETAAESGYVSLADRADTRMSAVSERQNRDYGTVKEDIPVIGGKGIGDLTQVLGSVLPSIVSGNLIGEAGTLLLFFGSAADSGYDEAIERGASADQAAWYSILTGAAEVAGEKISLENLLSGNVSGKMWAEVLKQAGIEGSEEGFTTLLNTLSDAWIMKDKSQFNERISELTMNGTDYETAVRQAFKETADSLAWDIVGGAISGGVSSGIQQGAMRIASAPARRAMQQADADLNALQENEQKLQQAQKILSDEELKAQAEDGDTGAQERRTRAQETAAEAREKLNELDTRYQRRATDGTEQGAAMQAEVEGERKEIKSFAYDEKTRKVYAVTTDGTDFNASEARLDRGTEYLVQQAEQHPKLADDMLNLYQPGQSAERYANAFIMTAELWGANSSLTEDEAYRASRLSNSVAYDLTTKQFRRAFELGQSMRTEAAQESATPRPAARYGAWSTYEDVTIDGVTYRAAKPSQIDPPLAEALHTLSKLFKTDIRLYASEADKSGKYSGRNGFYKDGVIYVDINAHANSTAEKSAVLLTIAHELTHELRESNEAGYRELRDFVIEHMVRSGTDIEQLAREKISEGGNPNMSLDDAVEEIVCNASERMLLNTKYAELMEKEKPNLFDAIRKWLSGLKDRIQKIFEGEGYSRENAYKEAKILWDVMDEMQEIWDRAMVQAQSSRLNGRQQRESGTESGTGVRTSSREWFKEDKYYARQIDQWDRKADGVRVKVGTLKEGSALNRVGFPAEGMWFDVGKIKKSFGKHGDHLTREILKQIPELLNDPIAITEYRGQDGQINNTANVFGLLLPDGNTPVVVGVVMTRAADGITVINKIRTIHARSNADINDDNVLYLNENKKKTRNWFQVCGNSVPLNGTRYGLIRSLTYKDADVKSSIREIIDEDGYDYGQGVYLDTPIFNGVKPRYWGKVLGDFIYNQMADKELVMYDEQGNEETVRLARTNDRVKKDSAKSSHKVLDKLARQAGDNTRNLAIVHMSELLKVSQNQSTSEEHSHQWLDENGWIYRVAVIQDKEDNVYAATLNIADGKRGKILYEINNVRPITGGIVSSTGIKNAGPDLLTSHNRSDVGTIPQTDADVKSSIRPEFAEEVQNWYDSSSENSRSTAGGYFKIGRTSDVLKRLGARDDLIYWRKYKIGTILEDHPAIDINVIKQVPEILESPTLVMKSRTVADSIVIFGNVNATNGEKVMAALELTPIPAGGAEAEFSLISSAYNRSETSIKNLIENSEILFVNKKEVKAWSKSLGVQFPSDQPNLDYVGRITYNGKNVNISGKTLKELGGVLSQVKASDRQEQDAEELYRKDKEKFADKMRTAYDARALEVINVESIKEEPDASVRGNEQSSMAQDTSDSSELKVADLLELVKGDAGKYIPERGGQFKGSSREYTYDYLASKDDMQLTEVVPKERYSRSDIAAEGMKNAAMFGYTNNSGNAVVYIKDTDTDVIVTEKSIRHGLDRRINNQAPVIEKLGEVLSNSVKVNELIPRTENTEKTFVYVGAAKDTDNRLYIATFIVNRNTNELESYDVLYAANAKKEPAALLPTSTDNSAMFTGSVISISDLLDKVNKLFPDILSEDVLRHFGRTERPQGKIGENVLYSSRETRDTAEEAKGREESAATLRRENRILRERIEHWKKQSRVTKEHTLRNTDTLEYARELVKRLDSAATSAEVNQGLQEMGAYLLNAENVDWDMLWEHALTLAHSMTDDVDIVISDEMKAEREDFESFLKSVPVDVAPLVKAGEISYSDLKGYPIVHRKNGTTVDDLYQQLQERFGEGIFPDVPDGGDMIDNIKRYSDAVQEIRGNPYADYLDETATLTALEIIDKLTNGELRQRLPTPMDRAEKKLNDQKEKAREQIAKIRRDKNARIAQIKAEGSARTQQRVAAERAKRTEAIKEVSAKYQEMIQQANSRRRENADRKKYREQVERIAGKLGTMLESNSDKKHIPEALKGTVENVLKSIDLTSTTYLKTGEQTQKDAGFFASMSKLNDILSDQNKALRGEEGSDGLDMYLDISDEVKQIMQEFVNKAREADIAGASYTVNDMDAAELRNLSMILTNLDHAVRDMNELFVKSKYENVTALAGAVIRYLDNLGKDRTRSKAGETVRQFLAWENLTPYYAFKRLGEGGETLFKGLRQGWDKLAYNAGDIIEFTNGLYTAKEARQWQKHINSFTLEDRTKIQMTDAQIMAYHCLSKREQARLHIDGGGIRIADIDTKAGQVKQTDHVRLSLKDMAMLERVLTDRQVEVADAMQKFMVEVCGEWGNEISMARYGYRAFTERNYFPIEVDGNDGKLVDPEVKSSDMWRLLNLSATKSTVPNAERALVIHDIFEVFTAHSADMAKYNALALPLLDLLKVVNYKDRIELDEKGAIKTKTTQKSLERAYGNIAKKYMTTFIKDMNSAHEGGTTTADRLTKRIISRYKAASVGANIRVAIQQPTAYVRAAMVLNPKYLAQGLKPVKGSTEEMLKHSGIAAWKDLGFVSTDIGRGMRDQIMHTETLADELTEKSMTLAEWGDKITWSALWRAAKAEVSDTTGLTGEELLKKTAERFEEIVYSTQVVDATMTRSHNMRNPGILAAMSTAYMAEPTLSYNIVLDAFSEWQRLKREGQNVKPAAEKMVRAIASYAASGAATLLAASLWDAFRDDDEYESFWQKYTSALFGDRQTKWYQSNVMQELLIWNKIPVLKDIWAVAMGDSVERMDMQPIQNMWKAIQIDWEAMQIMLGNVVPDEGEYSQMTGYGKVMANLRGFAQISGLPLYNMTRDVIAIYNTALSGFTGQKLRSYVPDSRRDIRDAYLSGFMTEEDAMKELVKTERADDENDAYWILQSWNKGNDVKSETMTAVLDAVKAGDRNAYTEAVKELTEHGVHATDIRDEITDAVQKWYQGTVQEKKSISKEQAVQLLTDYAKKNIDTARKTVEKWTCRLVTGMDFGSIRTEYIDGNISESRAVELYSTYGYGDRSKQTQSQIDEGKAAAEELVRKWKCTKETGMNYDSLQDYYAEGVLSYEDVKEWYIRYGGKTEEDAVRYANKTKFIGADSYPGITVKNTDVYYEYVDGMDKKLFAEAAKSVSKMKGEDKDGDGKSDAYSAMDKKLAYINGLPLSAEEKTRLAEALIGTDGKLSAAAYKRLPWK